jgi:hypothetical protein
MSDELIPYVSIETIIYQVRGQKVMVDKDLAKLYGVIPKYLNKQVKRNIYRFPDDFMFQLTLEEAENIKSQNIATNSRFQNGTLKHGKNIKYLPYAFTEHGILMLSSVLNNTRAINVNIQIMRAFTKLRQIIGNSKELGNKIELLEKRVFKHDKDIRELVRDIRKLTIEKSGAKLKIGFIKQG